MKLTQEQMDAAILGGCLLGGGGGGSMEKGRTLAAEAMRLGGVDLVGIDSVNPETVLLTCSAVGAPAARNACVTPEAAGRVVTLFERFEDLTVGGLITNECGGSAICNGWVPAAMSGRPVVDAPCNGRAHPTGLMGSMGLHRDATYLSVQSVAGGNREKGTYLEAILRGRMEDVSALVRQCSVRAGGLVSVARNPVSAAYARKHAAPGGVMKAIAAGEAMIRARARGGEAVAGAAMDVLGGTVVTVGRIQRFDLVTADGFDHGRVDIEGGFSATFWNEFMTLDRSGKRLYTFPDLVMTLDAESGTPLTTADLRRDMRVIVVAAPAANLLLGEGMRCGELFGPIETIVGEPILAHLSFDAAERS